MFYSKPRIRLCLLISFLMAANCFAVHAPPTPAPYVGAQIGWGKVHQDKISLSDVQRPGIAITNLSSSLHNQTGWAGRLFAGYLFSPTWGFEIGWSKFRDVSNRVQVAWSDGLSLNTNPDIKTDAIDVMVKGIYYFQNDFNIFAKLGAAYIMQRGHTGANVPGTIITLDQDAKHVYPTFSLGLGYDFICNWTADVSWTRIQKLGNSNASSTDLVAIGLVYKIV